jgi:small subunit ribosomal protein SAe
MDLVALKFIGVGLLSIGMAGAAFAIGNIFSSFFNGISRNPSASEKMEKYVYTQKRDTRVYLFDVNKQYEKILVAARMIAALPDPSTVVAISGRATGQRAVYKLGKFTGAQSCAGRWNPGKLTNQNTKNYVEPRLLILTDPRTDFNALKESAYMNIPIIALCNTDNSLEYVDCAIPVNNRSKKSLAMVYWLLTREVCRLLNKEFSEMIDLFMYRNIEEKVKKEEEDEKKDEIQDDDEAQGDDFVEN